jgi:cytochrome c5
MAGNDFGRYWDPLVMQQELSPEEKKLRDNFVTEYLKDRNPYLAAIRVGYLQGVALKYAESLMAEPYVQKEISRRQRDVTAATTKEQLALERHIVKQQLFHEAFSAPLATARVSALSKLCNILDMDGTQKIKSEVTHKGGVMLVPGISKVDEWEKQAAEQQDKLIAQSAEDRTAKPLH